MNTESVGYKAVAFELRNLVFFFLFVFGLRWLVDGLQIAGIVKASGAGLGLILLTLASWGPLIAAFVVTAITSGKVGVKALWGRFWNRNITLRWLLVAISIIPAVALGANLLTRLTDGQNYPWFFSYDPLWTILTVFLAAFVGSGMAEEFGWRGFVLPRFQARWNALASSLILGIIWALWHAGQWFIPNSHLFGRNVWLWGGGMLLLSIIMTWVFNNTRGSVLSAVVIHAMWNTGIFWHKVDWRFYSVLLVAVVIIVALFGAKELVRRKAVQASESLRLPKPDYGVSQEESQ
jgi:membrane protease YdiL (CAAX protease family)